MTRSPEYKEHCTLVPINIENETERLELIEHRRACGWHYTPPFIEEWRRQHKQKLKTLFWITIQTQAGADVRAGHISLDSLTESTDPDFQNSDRSTMTIKTFFVYKQYRSLGVGRKSMDILEDLATQSPHGSPNCTAIVVDCAAAKNFFGEGLENLRKFYPDALKGGAICNEYWYERRGYRLMKEVPGYPVKDEDGVDHFFPVSYLKKDLTKQP